MTTSPLLTHEGAARLRQEAEQLERVERKRTSDAIATARALGDLSENAEYHAAKEKQGMIEARIRQLRAILGTAQLVDVQALKLGETLRFGMVAKLLRLDNDTALSYQIVGELEADVSDGRLADTSPVAKALLGRKKDEVAVVSTPDGDIEYMIVSISLPSPAKST